MTFLLDEVELLCEIAGFILPGLTDQSTKFFGLSKVNDSDDELVRTGQCLPVSQTPRFDPTS